MFPLALLGALLGIFFLMLLAWMRFVEPWAYRVVHREARVRKPLSRPIRILHLSDIHFANPSPKLSRFFDELAAIPLDVVFVTGDIIDSMKGIAICKETLSRLKPSVGVFAVYGNHDYYDYRLTELLLHNFPGQRMPKNHQHVHVLDAALKEIGVHVLKNQSAEIFWHGTSLMVHGLDDPTSRRANLRKTMERFDPAKANVLLTHTIDAFLEIGRNEIDLSFSGHSHGGQICLPFLGPILTHTIMGRAFAAGFFQHKGAWCSVSRGIGTSRYLPMRLLCRPEAIVVTVSGDGISELDQSV